MSKNSRPKRNKTLAGPKIPIVVDFKEPTQNKTTAFINHKTKVVIYRKKSNSKIHLNNLRKYQEAYSNLTGTLDLRYRNDIPQSLKPLYIKAYKYFSFLTNVQKFKFNK